MFAALIERLRALEPLFEDAGSFSFAGRPPLLHFIITMMFPI